MEGNEGISNLADYIGHNFPYMEVLVEKGAHPVFISFLMR